MLWIDTAVSHGSSTSVWSLFKIILVIGIDVVFVDADELVTVWSNWC